MDVGLVVVEVVGRIVGVDFMVDVVLVVREVSVGFMVLGLFCWVCN